MNLELIYVLHIIYILQCQTDRQMKVVKTICKSLIAIILQSSEHQNSLIYLQSVYLQTTSPEVEIISVYNTPLADDSCYNICIPAIISQI